MKEPGRCPMCEAELGYGPGQLWPRESLGPGGLWTARCGPCHDVMVAEIRRGKDRRR